MINPFDVIEQRLLNIECLLLDIKHPSKTKETPIGDQWFDLKELCAYLPDKPKPPTVYGWVFTSKIPVHKGAKKLRFLKSEIDQWLLRGKVLSLEETALEVAKLTKKSRL